MPEYVTPEQIKLAAEFVGSKLTTDPRIALVLGSGLSGLASAVADAEVISTDTIPGWPVSTVAGHAGRLVAGRLEDKDVLVMQGRVHFYEGYSIGMITLPVRVMHELGITTLLVTNAAGGINPSFEPGDLMVITDHLNFPGLAGNNPLRGPNDEAIGPRFPDMTEPYDHGIRKLARQVAADSGFELREGTYAFVSGPSYETPAELRFLRAIGADAVGMSTVPSVIVARHAGLRVFGVSTITNIATPDPEPGQQTTHEEVLEVGALVVPRLTKLLHGIVRGL